MSPRYFSSHFLPLEQIAFRLTEGHFRNERDCALMEWPSGCGPQSRRRGGNRGWRIAKEIWNGRPDRPPCLVGTGQCVYVFRGRTGRWVRLREEGRHKCPHLIRSGTGPGKEGGHTEYKKSPPKNKSYLLSSFVQSSFRTELE